MSILLIEYIHSRVASSVQAIMAHMSSKAEVVTLCAHMGHSTHIHERAWSSYRYVPASSSENASPSGQSLTLLHSLTHPLMHHSSFEEETRVVTKMQIKESQNLRFVWATPH